MITGEGAPAVVACPRTQRSWSGFILKTRGTRLAVGCGIHFLDTKPQPVVGRKVSILRRHCSPYRAPESRPPEHVSGGNWRIAGTDPFTFMTRLRLLSFTDPFTFMTRLRHLMIELEHRSKYRKNS